MLANDAIDSDKLSVGAVSGKQFKTVAATNNSYSVVADCGPGYVAIGGGGSCTGVLNLSAASCPASGPASTTCSTASNLQRYWLSTCGALLATNQAIAICVKQ